ncbi:MAG: GNAT family N-acetyltransferase [Bacteroidota bacterium]
MAIEIRLLQSSESELANNFFNEIYRTHRPVENFRWEFIDGPKGKAIYVVAVEQAETSRTKIVGIQCAIPLDLTQPDGTNVLTAKSEDTLVHPDYRGQKLFERMYELLFEECKKSGIKYIWGFTPALKAFQRLGFEAPFQTTQGLLVFKPIQAFRYLSKLNTTNTVGEKIKIFGLCFLSYFAGLKRFFVSSTNANLQEVTPANKEQAIKNFYSGADLYFLRLDNQYLQWRLFKNPFGNNYRNFKGEKNGNHEADILLNTRRDVSYIEMMLFSKKLSFKDRVGFVRKCVGILADADTPLARTLCFGNNNQMTEQVNLLKHVGFLHLKRGNHFVWKSLDPENKVFVNKIFFSRLFTQGNV